MSRQKNTNELAQHKAQALQKLENYLDALIASGDSKKMGKADKLSYWLEDWTTFIDFESQFSPKSLRRYKRGEIIKVHLGFNIGSEEGGLHYAVVLDKNNAKSSPVITIVPLTSVKPTTDISNLKKGSIFLGNEIYTSLNAKMSATEKHANEELALLGQLLETMSSSTLAEQYKESTNRLNALKTEISLYKRIKEEIRNMRAGSIALVNQITTISKIRIYDPKTDHDILSNIRISNEKLDLIDNEMQRNFTNTIKNYDF